MRPSDSPSPDGPWGCQSHWGRRRVEYREVVLAAGGHSVDDDVRDRHVRRDERRLGPGLRRLASFHLLGEFFGARQCAGRRRLTRKPTPLLAVFCSARSESAAEIAARRSASAVSNASTSAGSSPRLSWDRRTASGSSRSNFRSITAARSTFVAPIRSRQMAEHSSRRPPDATSATFVTRPGRSCQNGADVRHARRSCAHR